MRASRLLSELPTRLVLLVLWTSVVASVFVLLRVFTPLVVLPALAVVLVLTWRLVPVPMPPGRAALVGALAALGLAGVWVAINVPYASEVLLVQRDPGFLTLQGLWLSHSPDPSVPLRTAAEVATQVPGTSVVSDAFWREGNQLYSQGEKGFPALIAMGGWVAGQGGVLAANVLIGGLALLAVYDVARRLTGPLLGLLPMAALALTTPFLYFTRTAFTEPTTVVLGFGAVTTLWCAVAGRDVWRYAMAGAMAGACALVRIDGSALVAGLAVGVGAVAVGTRDPGRRAQHRRGLLAAVSAAGLMVLLGYLDLRVNSPAYLAGHSGLYARLIAFVFASALGMLGLERVTRSPRVTGWLARHRRRLGRVGAGAVLVGAVVLASRPLWMTAHWFTPGSSYARFIAGFQQAAGVPVDGTRSYDEMTVTWLAWYLGSVTVALAAVGAALMLARGLGRRQPQLLALLAMLGVPSLLFVLQPSITPDQVWAMRRFLPVAIPAVLLGATWTLHLVLGRDPGWGRRLVVGGLAVVMLLVPVATWGELVGTVEYGGRADDVARMCGFAQSGRVVVVRGSAPLLPTLRIACDADVVEVGASPSTEQLAEIRRAWGDQPVLVMTYAPAGVPWTRPAQPATTTRITRWPHSLYPAREPVVLDSSVWVGTIAEDGSVEPRDPVV